MKEIALSNKSHLSNQIGQDEIETMWQEKKVALDCGTGMGKTTLINTVLSKVAEDKNASILFLSSRTALTKQQMVNLKLLGVENVEVRTYQWLENVLNKDPEFTSENYAFIVSDECHYFTNDSVFNNNTAISYRWIEKQPSVVYMSGTGYIIFKYMENEEMIDLYYHSPRDYSYVDSITFCHTDKHMVECLNDIYHTNDKAIIFMEKTVRDGGLGTKVHTPMMNWYLDNQDIAHFVCSKGKKEYNTINEFDTAISEGTYEKQFLFTTQTLDVGVDIIDTKVKHVIVEHFDIDSVFQMLGRVRHKENVKFYLRIHSKQQLSGRAQTIQNDYIKKVKHLEALSYDERWKYCLRGMNFNSHKGLFYIDIWDNKMIKVNELILFKQQDMYDQCMSALLSRDGRDTHPHIVKWTSTFNECGFKGEYIDMGVRDFEINNKRLADEVLDPIVGVKLDKQAQRDLADALDFRNAKNNKLYISIKGINGTLEELELPYEITTARNMIGGERQTYWIVSQVL